MNYGSFPAKMERRHMNRKQLSASLAAESTAADVLRYLRRLAERPDRTTMLGAACADIGDLIPASGGVVLFEMHGGVPVSVLWPERAGYDSEVFRHFRSEIAKGLPIDAATESDPVTWRRGCFHAGSPANRRSEAFSVGITVRDGFRKKVFLLVLHRAVGEPPFGEREATVLRVLSSFVSRILTLRSKADDSALSPPYGTGTAQEGSALGP
ncbi:MAG TPA: hypothetical protein VMW87_13815 [Spirochaetia bacterium]|nr:hypothetical protein [Spirochaetia bacterium]